MLNLILIRAAIEARTGYRLTFDAIRSLLIEEGLASQADALAARAYLDYSEFFDREEFSRVEELCLDDVEGLPD